MSIPELFGKLPTIVAKETHFDKVQVWLDRCLTRRERRILLEFCDDIHVESRPMRFHPGWVQRVQLYRPDPKALTFLLGAVPRHLVNMVEITLNLVVDNGRDAELLQEFFERHLVWRRRAKQRRQKVSDTTYFTKRKAARNIVIYSDQMSKISGQHCCHIEARIKSKMAVESIGILDLLDLVKFSHQDFWKKFLRLRAVDLEGLGRDFYGTKRRKTSFETDSRGRKRNMDAYAGRIIADSIQFAALAEGMCWPSLSVQELLDRSDFKLRRAFVPIPNDKFLP